MLAGPDNGGTTGPTARQDPSLPQVFGRYLLVQRLSRGGMGEIFLAKHGLAGFEKLAVIKKVLPHLAADPGFISRFVDEAQVAIKLQHVNVAQVFEVGRVGDEYFLALEYVEGRDLRRTLSLLTHRRQRFPVDLALYVGRELANGLAYAHRRTSADGSSLNLVHCDISPPNVVVSFEGETKVIDFGIAKSALRGTATDPKMGFGKFGYMAPEQLIRGGLVDHRTDIYAAGVVLYELLTGQRLYEAGSDPDYRALAKKVSRGEHALPSHHAAELAPYDGLVARALRPRPDERFQSAAEFRDAIQQALVAVNPTISTDQLGTYMRDLFADEMLAQRELHERIANAHLADFQEEFHTQGISTVTFALSGLPMPGEATTVTPIAGSAPEAQPGAQPIALDPGPRPAPGPSLDEPGLADGTGSALREPPLTRPRRRALPIVLAALALAVALGALAVVLLRDDAPAPAAPVAATDTITFEPIVGDPPPGPGSAGSAIEAGSAVVVEAGSAVVVEAGSAALAGSADEPGAGSGKPIKRPVKRVEPGKGTPAVALTRDAVAAKFSATSREYEAYKTQNGMRLDGAWNELTTFIQFKMTPDNLDDAMRRIDGFRTRMRE